MRKTAGFLLLAVFVVPFVIYAETVTCDPKKEKNCQGSKDACISEKISIKDGKVIFTTTKPGTYDFCVKQQCTYAKEKAQQCWCGRETFEIAPGKMSKLDISRCDPNLSKLVSAAMGSAASNVSSLFSEQDVIKRVAQSIPVNDTATLSAVLRGVGIEGATEEVVQRNPQAAYDLLQGIANGDESATQSAAEKLGLNADLSEAKTLQAKLGQSLQDNISPEKLFSTPYTFSQTPDTGVSDMERAKRAIACIESGCGNYNAIGPRTRTGARAFGKYQVMDFNVPSWTARACGRALNPYAFLADRDCQEKVFEGVYGSYVSSCGSYEAAASKWFSGSCTIRNTGDGWLSVPGYVQKFSRYFASSSLPFGSQSSPYTGGTSPFAQINPASPWLSPDSSSYTGSPFAAITGRPAQIGGFPGYSPPIQSSYPEPLPPVPPAPIQASPTTPVAQAVATIVVQPKNVVRGNPITVSWTSLGMSATTPCEVRGSTVVGQGNGGSKIVPTGPATPTGVMTFTLTCTAQSGQQITQSASTNVQ